MKKILIINGLIASGKNTIGRLLTEKFTGQNIRAIFYDIDEEVKRLNPQNYWENDQEELTTWLSARKNYAEAANIYKGDIVVVAGPFFTRDEIVGYCDYIHPDTQVFLYTLSTTLNTRLERNKYRAVANDPKDILEQEKIFETLSEPQYGELVDNNSDVTTTVDSIMELFSKNQGLLDKGVLR